MLTRRSQNDTMQHQALENVSGCLESALAVAAFLQVISWRHAMKGCMQYKHLWGESTGHGGIPPVKNP